MASYVIKHQNLEENQTIMRIPTTGSYQHCKEIAQETCYNKPSAGPKPEQVRAQKGKLAH